MRITRKKQNPPSKRRARKGNAGTEHCARSNGALTSATYAFCGGSLSSACGACACSSSDGVSFSGCPWLLVANGQRAGPAPRCPAEFPAVHAPADRSSAGASPSYTQGQCCWNRRTGLNRENGKNREGLAIGSSRRPHVLPVEKDCALVASDAQGHPRLKTFGPLVARATEGYPSYVIAAAPHPIAASITPTRRSCPRP